jgi:hypothetical protein
MPDDGPSAGWDRDELEVTDLRARRGPAHLGDARRPHLAARAWRRLALGLGLVLLVAALVVLMVGPLSGGGALRALLGLPGAAASPTSPAPTTAAVLAPTETVSAARPPTPAAPQAVATPQPGGTRASVVPTLGPAPASCGGEAPALVPGGPPHFRATIGRAPVLLGGFVGPYATLPLGPEAAAAAKGYGWAAPYTPYGWPAPIGLILLRSDHGRPGSTGPVTLAGRDPRTGHPLWFGLIEAGVWGPPAQVTPGFTLDPARPFLRAGGEDVSSAFWYGYAFLPGAGCYTLAATWPGGGWQVTVSAGQ